MKINKSLSSHISKQFSCCCQTAPKQITADAFRSPPHSAGLYLLPQKNKRECEIKLPNKILTSPTPVSPPQARTPPRQEQEQSRAALTVAKDEELPWEPTARRAEPTGSGGWAGTRPRHCGSGRTAAAASRQHRGPGCRGRRGALRPWHVQPTARPLPHGTATATEGLARRNLPVPMILSILTLALSSSLAKRCTACIGSSQVSGSMYVLLVGTLTAGEQETHKGHVRKAQQSSCPPAPGNALAGYPSPGLLAGLPCHLFISKAKDTAFRLLGNFLQDYMNRIALLHCRNPRVKAERLLHPSAAPSQTEPICHPC